MDETEKPPEKPKKSPFESVLLSASLRLGEFANALGGLRPRWENELREAQESEDRWARAAALGLTNQAAPSSSDKNTGPLPEFGERAGIDYQALAEALSRDASPRMYKGPNQCRFLVKHGQQNGLRAIISKRLIPYDHTAFSENHFGLPKNPLRRIAAKSGNANYLPEEIAWLFIDWYFFTFNPIALSTVNDKLPIDLALEMIALHVERGYDPPWIDEGLTANLRAFKEGINRAALTKRLPLQAQGRALYEIFLAFAYPNLADPAITITTPPAVEKPLEPEKKRKKPHKAAQVKPETPGNAQETPKGSRKRRALDIAPLEPISYRKKR